MRRMRHPGPVSSRRTGHPARAARPGAQRAHGRDGDPPARAGAPQRSRPETLLAGIMLLRGHPARHHAAGAACQQVRVVRSGTLHGVRPGGVLAGRGWRQRPR